MDLDDQVESSSSCVHIFVNLLNLALEVNAKARLYVRGYRSRDLCDRSEEVYPNNK